MGTHDMGAADEFTELADAIRVVQDWRALARDERADLRDRYEADLKARGASEVMGRIRAALEPR
jgi:hypothetical protein